MAKKKQISYYVPKEHEREGNHWCKNNGYEVWVEETAHKANLYKIFVQKGDKRAEMNKIYKEEEVWQAYYALSFKIMNDKLNKTTKITKNIENGKEAGNTEDTKKPEADRWQEKQQTLAI